MSNLLKTDFFRFIKSKITLIALIIAVAFPIFSGVLYLFVKYLYEVIPELSTMQVSFSAKAFFASGYACTNDGGLIIPIFCSVLIAGDVSNGTLRNKVISGGNKTSVYLSNFIVGFIFNVVLINIYVFVSLFINILFFGYGTDFNIEELKFILVGVGLGSLMYIYVSSIITLLALLLKNTSLTIIFTIVMLIVFGIGGSLMMLIKNDKFDVILSCIPIYSYNVFANFGLNCKSIILILGCISFAFFSVVNVICGIIAFKKLDIK